MPVYWKHFTRTEKAFCIHHFHYLQYLLLLSLLCIVKPLTILATLLTIHMFLSHHSLTWKICLHQHSHKKSNLCYVQYYIFPLLPPSLSLSFSLPLFHTQAILTFGSWFHVDLYSCVNLHPVSVISPVSNISFAQWAIFTTIFIQY